MWRSNNRSILGFPDSFKSLATEFAWGLNKTVLVALVLAFALWFVLEHTALGRYLFATGGAREAARLAGVQTDRYVWGSLVTSAMFAIARRRAARVAVRLDPGPVGLARTCCRRSPPRSSVRPSSSTASTCGARCSPCSCCSRA